MGNESMARMLNGLMTYREYCSEARDAFDNEVDANGDFDDELLAYIQNLAEQYDCVAGLDDNSCVFIMTRETLEDFKTWSEKARKNDEGVYFSHYFMDKAIEEIDKFDNINKLLNYAHDLIRLEINRDMILDWLLCKYKFSEEFEQELFNTESFKEQIKLIALDKEADIEMVLEACRRLVLHYVKDVDNFFRV